MLYVYMLYVYYTHTIHAHIYLHTYIHTQYIHTLTHTHTHTLLTWCKRSTARRNRCEYTKNLPWGALSALWRISRMI